MKYNFFHPHPNPLPSREREFLDFLRVHHILITKILCFICKVNYKMDISFCFICVYLWPNTVPYKLLCTFSYCNSSFVWGGFSSSGYPTATMDSTFNFAGILRISEIYSSEVMVSLCSLSLICIQQLPRSSDNAARWINIEAIEASSTQTSHFSGSAQTTIPRLAFFKNVEPCFFAVESLSSVSLSVTTINSHGFSPLDDGARSAASTRRPIFPVQHLSVKTA